MTTRREFIKWTAAGGAGLVAGRGLLSGRARAAASRAPAVWARGASVASGLTPYLDPIQCSSIMPSTRPAAGQ